MGALVKPVYSQIIDLSSEKATKKASIRKSYGSLINWGIRELHPNVYDATTITWEHMEAFRQIHIKEAGRKTRSKMSWKRQYEMVQAGEAFVVLGNLENEIVSAGFFMTNKTNCYYLSSASRRDLFEKPLFHALMWTAILYAKKHGCRWFEVGEQLFPNHLEGQLPTKKELGISDFKAGFG
jgi:lipid II:glycine glycyltransferase (peptidoglycan interpeptide bridge formation enzyme)